MTSQPPLHGEDDRLQVAALCWRKHPILEVLLVTSLSTKRWIVPKGWPHPGLSLAQSAAREAQEEAGVTGMIEPAPLGSYHYLKEKGDSHLPCRVEVFALAVSGQQHFWPEKGARELLWLPAGEALKRVSEPGLRPILQAFRKDHAVGGAPLRRRGG
ncbi:MAG TPA: NUDIX hydrolase [Rhizomicrobium sp.]|nr:NUDIX hydrolase [Rhizomicrobium sp.]